MESIKAYVIKDDNVQFPVEILKPSGPRTKSQKCNDPIKMKSVDYFQEDYSNMLIKRSFQTIQISLDDGSFYLLNNLEQKQNVIKHVLLYKDIKKKKRNI